MSPAILPRQRATLADLAKAPGKAELVNGKVIELMATGFRPNIVAGRIFRSLADHADKSGIGYAFTDNMRFAIPELSSGRESFAPDVSYFTGALPANRMRFVEGAPYFAVEVRSEGDYGPAAERDLAVKRSDYFEAGTKVVWDVDPVAREIRVYRADAADQPTVFGSGSEADAEPAVPSWRISTDWVMA
ncbi:MAG TPA: Uma2 family endonuclease [Urbifossiella sp.]|nr:Uma2 family endonuclease [Urbifossiella sp.]